MNILKSGLLLITIFLFNELLSQIIYTDLEPDTVMHFGNFPVSTKDYYFDVNGDAAADFNIRFSLNWGSSSISMIPLNNTEFIYKQSSDFLDTLAFNHQVDNSGLWINTSLYMVSMFGSNTTGTWASAYNKFVGIRLKLNSDFYYGWIRLRNYFTVCDFAVNFQSNEPITTGDGMPYKAENVSISDVSNFHDGQDIQVSFEIPLNEFLLTVYRIIAVKSSEAVNFTVDSANSTQSGNYTEVPVAGTNYSFTLPAGATDFKGDTIAEFIPYNIFVLSVANGIDTAVNLLSNPSHSLMLTSPTEPITNLQAEVQYLGGYSYDVHITFNKINDESLINSYRLIFVKENQSSGFNIDSANNVSEEFCTIIQPTGTNYSFTYSSADLKDKNGNLLAKKIGYKAFILTIADGFNTNVNALSNSSNTLTLSVPVKPATYVIAEDINNTGSGFDLQVSFNKALVETGISEYRLIAVNLSDTTDLIADSLLNLPSSYYITVQPTGNNIIVYFDLETLDKDGQPIFEQVPYKIYVLSIPDYIVADDPILSNPSNIITLSSPDYLKAGQSSGINIIYTNLEPDSTLWAVKSTIIYLLDLDNDNIDDFKFSATHQSSPMFSMGFSSVEPLNNNAVAIIPSSNYPDTLSFSCMINHDLYWRQELCNVNYYYSDGLPGGDTNWGIWADLTDKFIGLQLIAGSDTLYGWVGIAIGYTSFTIRDYALLTSPSGLHKTNLESGLIIYPNPAKDIVTIENIYSSPVFATLRDLNGTLIITQKLQFGNNNLEIKDLASGYYLVTILDNQNQVLTSEKIMKK